MAEYYPLLDRAVSGLTDTTAEARRSIYERARTALIGQLRRMEPPVPEEDIARESTALDEAIARVEARFADGPGPEAPAAPIGVPPRPAPPSATPAATRVSPPGPPHGAVPPVVPPPSRERPPVGQRTAPSVDGSAVPVTPPSATDSATPARRMPPRAAPSGTAPARPTLPPRGTRPVMALRPVVDGAARPSPGTPGTDAARRDDGGLPPAGRLASDPPAAPDVAEASTEAFAGRRDGSDFTAALDAAGRADGGDGGRPSGLALGQRGRDAALRPPAPRPRQDRRFGSRAAAVVAVIVLVMVGIGVLAYRLRVTPDQVVAAHADAAPEAAAPEKMAARAGAATSDAATGSEPTSGATDAAPAGQTGSDPGASTPAIAVTQRAALLVDAPDDPQRVKTYVGTVVWHLDSVSPGQGQPLATAVKADVDIPDAKLKVTMLMQKNPEPQLPASHTIEFHFLPQPDNALGPIKQINVPEMRKDDDAATGDPLAGVPVAITDNYFLVGLSRGGAEGQNIRLMTERNWFDMSLLFVSGKLGKLTFEKGAAGQRTFEDALKAWK